MTQTSARKTGVTLPAVTLVTYLVLLVVGSLYPLRDWQTAEPLGLRLLFEPWPRYSNLWEVLFNVAIYLPLGALGYWLHLVLIRHWLLADVGLRHHTLMQHADSRANLALTLTALQGCCISYGLETMQYWLPTRHASKLDWLANSLGTLAAALLLRHFGEKKLLWLSEHAISSTHALAFCLLGLWCLPALSPGLTLFAIGDLSLWLPLPSFSHPATDGWAAAVLLLATVIYLDAFCTLFFSKSLALPLLLLLATAAALKYGDLVAPSATYPLTLPAIAGSLGLAYLIVAVGKRRWRPVNQGLLAMVVAALVSNLLHDPNRHSPLWFTNLDGLLHLLATIWPLTAAALMWAKVSTGPNAR